MLIPCRLYEKCKFTIAPFRQKIHVYFVGNLCEFVDKTGRSDADVSDLPEILHEF